MNAYYIFRKRSYTNHMRTQDIIMVVYADPKHPPYSDNLNLGLRKIRYDAEYAAKQYNNSNSLRNVLRYFIKKDKLK